MICKRISFPLVLSFQFILKVLVYRQLTTWIMNSGWDTEISVIRTKHTNKI